MILNSILALTGVGMSLAVLLAIASRLLSVEEDPRIEAVMEALPGANCGGCGYAGCEGYAIAVVQNPDISAGLCTVGGMETAKAVGTLTGKAGIAGEPTVCFRRCAMDEGNVLPRYDYIGTKTCA
ncbi:MAG: (Fe-S)-binding protein, partial [Thiotrichaceae bacterium]